MAASDEVKLAQYDSVVAENVALRAELEEVKLVRRPPGSSSERAFDVGSTAAGETASSGASTSRESVMSLAWAGETPGSDEQQAGSDLDSGVDAKSVGSSSLATTMVSETEDERTTHIEREMEAAALHEEETERIYQENKRHQQEARAVPEASRRQLRSVLLELEAEHMEEKTKTFDPDQRKRPTASAKGVTIPSVTPTLQSDGGLRSQTVQAPFDLVDRKAENRGDLEEHGLLYSFVSPLVSARSSQFAAYAIVKFRYKKGQF
ncbi:hypothetical protein LTR15_007446 [Elasticomyces elasticus]|nr:hypothetical protein LTR15_007446 [Elasticomyces elasticus]